MSIRNIYIAQWTPPGAISSLVMHQESPMDIYKTDRSSYAPSDFLQWQENQTLILTPKFQRREVWKTPAKSFFIDTLLREMPIPPIYLRNTQEKKPDGKIKTVREVVDGQQRVKAVLHFMEDRFQLSRNLDAPWKGQWFSKLKPEEQIRIHKATFPCEVFKDIPDEDVLKVFARLNIHSVKLNDQELRNGRFFGSFKQSAYKLANEQYKFWINYRVFGATAISRMDEVEFTSELLIAAQEGMQHKKKSITDFYMNWDEEYPNQEREEKRFRETMSLISDMYEGEIDAVFRGPPFFYTLYCALFHRRFGLPGIDLGTDKRPLSETDKKRFRTAVTKLSEIVSTAREDPAAVPEKFTKFAAASLGQTTNLEPRKERLKTLYKQAFV